MKKQLSLLALSLATAIPLSAAAEGSYIGVNAGRADQKVTWVNDGSYKDDSTAYKVYGGYGFTKYVGIEGGYTRLGKLTENWVDAPDSGTNTFKSHALYVAATGTLPLNDQFSLFGKLGVAHSRVKGTFVENGALDSTLSQSRTTPLVGIGASYQFAKNFAVVAEYEDYGNVVKFDEGKVKARTLSVGLRYGF